MVATIANAILAAVPDPGQGSAPPGADKLLLLLKWGAYIALFACVGGVIYAGVKMIGSHQGGRGGGEHAMGLVWVFAACIIVGTASGIVTQLV